MKALKCLNKLCSKFEFDKKLHPSKKQFVKIIKRFDYDTSH